MHASPKTADDHDFRFVDSTRVPVGESLLVERHVPTKFAMPYHHHASVELNLLTDCEMEYSMAGAPVRIREDRLVIFWGAVPHCVTSVTGKGQIINVYVSLSLFLGWKLPQQFVSDVIGGGVLCSAEADPIDALVFTRWADDFRRNDPGFREILVGEAEMRIRRFAAGNWQRLRKGSDRGGQVDVGSAKMGTVEEMLRFIADNYASPLGIAEMAAHVKLSESYAMTLFRGVTGISIKEHITRTRLSHAQMLLSKTDEKILAIAMDSGFGSLSAFYESFQARTGQTPGAFRRQTRSASPEKTGNVEQ